MKTWIKWTAGLVGAVVVVVAGAGAVGYKLAESKMARKVEVTVKPVAYVTDAQSLERGKYLFESRGCVDCHGANGGGRTFVENDKGLKLAGPNITPGGATAGYKPDDWVRIIRHGVKSNGQAAMIMPSEDYNRFTDQDLASLVAYVRGLPPVTGGAAVVQLPVPVRVLYGFGAIKDAAAKIDHSLPPAQPVAAGVTVQHGAYVANMCIGCHGEKLSGGKIPGGPPDWPAAANITPGEGSAMTRYKDSAAFVTMLRSGKRPDGTPIKVMPFESLAKLNDVDAQAIYEFLKTVPPRPAGGR
ncbi:c-type cytochrome [Ramlibacter sp. WS9]|uniref:c-type cytochrome n=1 Tax=Ramlibacter sp. WS9 TaxID=1882741 RepID=UPI001144171F|nr:c-type cytochrome [Ramlibacter sp. WS9]ROZ72744.1 cytochrome c [Ramlibacter sp. WS9]